MASKPTSGNRMRATRVSQRMTTTRPDLGQRLIIWSRRQWMCVFINLNTFPMISLFEFFDKLDERIFPADVAGENDIRQAGKFCLRAKLPHRHTRQNLAENHRALHAETASRQI